MGDKEPIESLTDVVAKHISDKIFKSIERFLDGDIHIKEVPKEGKDILQGMLKDPYQRSDKESEALHELRLRMAKEHPGIVWDTVEVMYRTFVLSKILLKHPHKQMPVLSKLGQQNVFHTMSADQFKMDLAKGYLGHEYDKLNPSEQAS